jgi:hypothetical protein
VNDKPYPFTPEQEAWLRDLETTEEPQTKRYLHLFSEHDDFSETLSAGYCCLGRACVVLGATECKNGPIGLFDGNSGRLSNPLMHRLRLRGRGQSMLISLNDRGKSFKQIAAYIRANPHNVFFPSEGEAS